MEVLTSITSLPNELLDNVISNLEDQTDLISLRKAHRHFQRSTRRLLMKHIRLPLVPTDANRGHINNFFCAIAKDTQLLECFQHLDFLFAWKSEATLTNLFPTLFVKKLLETSYTAQEHHIPIPISKLANLRCITIKIAGLDPLGSLEMHVLLRTVCGW
jgi:hypothetical protein